MSRFATTSQEWDDPRLESARREVGAEIKAGVHRYLILNLDQVWRQSLRFGKKLLVKGKQRASDRFDLSQLCLFLLGRLGLSPGNLTIYIYI